MNSIATIIWRDVRQSYASGGTWLPVIFYLSAATLFPFAVGPDRALLLQTGGGILWIAALLATLLPLDRLIQPDLENRDTGSRRSRGHDRGADCGDERRWRTGRTIAGAAGDPVADLRCRQPLCARQQRSDVSRCNFPSARRHHAFCSGRGDERGQGMILE